MYKKLLVAVDGSDVSLHAFKEALRISRTDVLVLSVAPPYSGDLRVVGTDLGNLLRQPCIDALGRAEEAARAAGAEIRPVCVMAEPYEAIVETAEDEGRDLIVMGVKTARFLVGSTTARVIGYSSQDVLVVPESASIAWERIMVATDGSQYSRKATQKALDLAQFTGAALKVLSILEISSHVYAVAPEFTEGKIKLCWQYVDEVKELAAARGVAVEGLVRESECADQVIVEMARQGAADLIILGSHGRTGIKRLLMGSVTERVIAHSPCPVLVVKL